MLSDVLLGIFDLYVDEGRETKKRCRGVASACACVADGEAYFLDHY